MAGRRSSDVGELYLDEQKQRFRGLLREGGPEAVLRAIWESTWPVPQSGDRSTYESGPGLSFEAWVAEGCRPLLDYSPVEEAFIAKWLDKD
jgi:hypothetical protein